MTDSAERKVIKVDNFDFETNEAALADAVVTAHLAGFFDNFEVDNIFWFSFEVSESVKLDVDVMRVKLNEAADTAFIGWHVDTVVQEKGLDNMRYINCLISGLTIQEAMLL